MRQAFLHAVPRQDIVDRLIIPLNENAIVRNAQVAVPGEPFYDELVANNGSDEYAETDIALSQQILDEAGIDTTTPIDVRLLTDSENPRRQSEYELIRESVGPGRVRPGRTPADPTGVRTLANTSVYDAALFGWQTTAIAVADSMPNYVTDGINNFYGYNNPEVDALGDELNVDDRSGPPGRDPDRGRAEPVRRCVRSADLPAPVDHGLQQHLRRWREQHRHRPDGVLQRLGLDGGLLSRRSVTVTVTVS